MARTSLSFSKAREVSPGRVVLSDAERLGGIGAAGCWKCLKTSTSRSVGSRLEALLNSQRSLRRDHEWAFQKGVVALAAFEAGVVLEQALDIGPESGVTVTRRIQEGGALVFGQVSRLQETAFTRPLS